MRGASVAPGGAPALRNSACSSAKFGAKLLLTVYQRASNFPLGDTSGLQVHDGLVIFEHQNRPGKAAASVLPPAGL
jgi:hypothetical protein